MKKVKRAKISNEFAEADEFIKLLSKKQRNKKKRLTRIEELKVKQKSGTELNED